MRTECKKVVAPIGIGVFLAIVILLGAHSCELEKLSCPGATSSYEECAECLESKGGCHHWYFEQDTQCTCE